MLSLPMPAALPVPLQRAWAHAPHAVARSLRLDLPPLPLPAFVIVSMVEAKAWFGGRGAQGSSAWGGQEA